jgi:hypothetical protein
MMQFRSIDPTGLVTIPAEYNDDKWLFNTPVILSSGFTISADTWHSLGSYPSGTTTRGQYRGTSEGELEIDINLTGTPSSGTASFPNTLPAGPPSYRPAVTKRIPSVQGAGTGWVSISTAGVVSCIIAAGGTATFDCPGRVNLS